MGRFCYLTRVMKPRKKILISGRSAMNQFSSTRNYVVEIMLNLIKPDKTLPATGNCRNLKFHSEYLSSQFLCISTPKLCCLWISGFEMYACRSMNKFTCACNCTVVTSVKY